MEEKYVIVREKPWKDLEDNNHIYKKGDVYPREGLEVSKKRIKELSGTKNKIGEVLIAKVEDTIKTDTVVINENDIIPDGENIDNNDVIDVETDKTE